MINDTEVQVKHSKIFLDLGKLWLFINSGCCVWGLMVSRTFLDLIDDSKKKKKEKKGTLILSARPTGLKESKSNCPQSFCKCELKLSVDGWIRTCKAGLAQVLIGLVKHIRRSGFWDVTDSYYPLTLFSGPQLSVTQLFFSHRRINSEKGTFPLLLVSP